MEHAVTDWSGSYSPGTGGRSFSSATGTFTYGTGSYTGSPSFVSLPTFSPRSPIQQPLDPRVRLSRITERTEESRPSSGTFTITASNIIRAANATPDGLRRSSILGTTPSHSRFSTDPSSDRTLPPAGRLSELRAVFESQSPSGSHSRAASSPGFRSSSPMFGIGQSTTTYPSYGQSSRPSSPSKSGSGSSGSYGTTSFLQSTSLLSPPNRPTTTTPSDFRSTTPGGTRTGSYTTPSYTADTWTNTHTPVGSYTTPDTTEKSYNDSKTYTGSYSDTDNLTRTPTSGLRRPQTSPRSPLTSVRNIVNLWKERTPAAGRTGEKSAPGSTSSVSPPQAISPENDGLYGIRRRVEGARARLREARAVSNPAQTNTRPIPGDNGDSASIRSGRSGVFPPGFDMNELSNYAQTAEPVSAESGVFFLINFSHAQICPIAAPHRPSLVPQRPHVASLSVATVSGAFVSTHAPPLLACTRRRPWYRCPGSPKLHKRAVNPFADSS
jgi:hypothetical protein